ncbi:MULTISPECIES: DMT family transporter [Arthrobacter]|uniref:DMT family transporter n=2 Tax=Arthrobacter TaxID=1663 RepID=A0ABU9KL51_9MICC|nr:DMT family transporter [Arthrobacter sp. YJM1]MDP5226917.1 DMT family transporter [Arthrobacter sp. YJM1]
MNALVATLGILGVSASGPLISGTLAGTTVGALAIAFWRNAIAAVVMGGPEVVRRPQSFAQLGRRALGYSALAGFSLALHFVCFIYSLSLTSVAASTALVCLQSGWIAIIQLFRGARHSWHVLVGLGISFLGVVAITGFDLGTSPHALWGDILAILGGVLAGVYTLAGSKARESMTTGAYTGICYGICAAAVLVMAVASGQPLLGFSFNGWLGIVAITVAAQLLGHTSLNHLVGHLSALVVSTLVLLEIPGAAILAVVFLDQVPPAGTYLGLALILVGLVVVIVGQRGDRTPLLEAQID